jgi:hypothetical protein
MTAGKKMINKAAFIKKLFLVNNGIERRTQVLTGNTGFFSDAN